MDFNEAFEKVWAVYPKKLGKKKASACFKRTVQDDGAFKNIVVAIKNYRDYLQHNNTESKYIQHGSTWFNNWEDWLDYQPIEKEGVNKNAIRDWLGDIEDQPGEAQGSPEANPDHREVMPYVQQRNN